MKFKASVLMALIMALFIAGCDGSGSSKSPIQPPPPVVTEKYHKVGLNSDGSLLIEPAIEGADVVGLVKGGNVASLPGDQVKSIRWNSDACMLWPYKTADYVSSLTIISGLNVQGDTGMITVLAINGEVYFLNDANIDVSKSNVKITVEKGTGMMSYGDGKAHCVK